MRREIENAQTLVVKIGSSLLLDDDALNHKWLAAMAADLATYHAAGKRLIIVTSGAVSLGRVALGFVRRDPRADEP
jgi:glutamate 5-kinase